MNKIIAIIAGEPNSISSEIIFKTWKSRKKCKLKPFFIIGSIKLLEQQSKKLKYNIKIKKIDQYFNLKNLETNLLPVYDVKYEQKKPFEKVSKKSNSYIFKSFDVALKLLQIKKISGLINCPVSKETLFGNKNQGITEFISKKAKVNGNEVMLIFNKSLAVSPVTTHIPLNNVSKKLSKNRIINNINVINNFYKKKLNKLPKFFVLGLNPHNFSTLKNSEEKKIIRPAIKVLKKNKLRVIGPVSPDSSFIFKNKVMPSVIIGMYHDQVLTPFKTLFKFNAINITLGLPFFRVSPDHGIGENIMGRNVANPQSLIESIKFFSLVK